MDHSPTTAPQLSANHEIARLLRGVTTHARAALARLDWSALLLMRLAMGLLFASTGWGKLQDLDKVAAFFSDLHIPFPALNAIVVANSEWWCGLALVFGVLTRLAALPLVVSMIVALITARSDDIGGVLDLVALEEFTYLVMLLAIVFLGPGRVSVDAWLAKKLDR